MVIEAYNFFVNLQSRYRLDNCGTDQPEIGLPETILEYPIGKIARLQGNNDADTIEIDFVCDVTFRILSNDYILVFRFSIFSIINSTHFDNYCYSYYIHSTDH